MKPENNEFHLNRPCEITDVNCWQNQLGANFNCEKRDKNCWKNKLTTFPCDVGNVECWKKQYPDIPCEHHDKECWNGLLPQNLPCKTGDQSCWDKLKHHDRQQKSNKIASTLLSTDKDRQQSNVDNEFDRYYSYGFGII